MRRCWRWRRWPSAWRSRLRLRRAIRVGGRSRWFGLGWNLLVCEAPAWGRSGAGLAVGFVVCRSGACPWIAFCYGGGESPVFGRGSVRRRSVCGRSGCGLGRLCHEMMIGCGIWGGRLGVRRRLRCGCCICLRLLRYVVDFGVSRHFVVLQLRGQDDRQRHAAC
jgi:hypothetical protein